MKLNLKKELILLNIFAIILSLTQCRGFYTYYYKFPENHIKKREIKKEKKIGIFLNKESETGSTSNNIDEFKNILEKANLKLIPIRSEDKIKLFDLIIVNFEKNIEEGKYKTLENISDFLSYSTMIITLGLSPGTKFRIRTNKITFLYPKTHKNETFTFTEYYMEKDGWYANYLGRKMGTFQESKNRFFIEKVSDSDLSEIYKTVVLNFAETNK
ncbi:hypothetical protein [Leptospira vanthielii]|uniref:Lipoprotein n=1 Tax=Leptospira vanthielii serovar Holland str. Waz Holland = ATCC 700522 TaxID=1218591 RepID=N1W9S2_9LEPT|nr:hypothetical protein [Leptospira vanthielii]EMY68621.1 hypothetical protein LEP1GSC199_1591 [Leptospira vanthielii serovar Holland str. Waz Holland = ATCC 700522]